MAAARKGDPLSRSFDFTLIDLIQTDQPLFPSRCKETHDIC
jgi:hypothetical protein